MKRIPIECPSCKEPLAVTKMACQECETGIDGMFKLPTLAQLPVEEQEFILQFVKVSGSLKEMARLLKLSYPTVRNRLNDIIQHCHHLEPQDVDE